jgi:hypothetical protein
LQIQNQIIKHLLSFGIGYLRWTQLVPMLFVWGLAVVMALAMVFVNFQQQSLTAMSSVLEWLVQLPLVGERIAAFFSEQNGETRITSEDFKSFLLRTWMISSLLFFLVGLGLSTIFGPFRPWTLKRKIALAAAASLLLLAGLSANYYAVPENFNGSASSWLFNFSMLVFIVFLVSAYSLSVSHFLLWLSRQLENGSQLKPA